MDIPHESVAHSDLPVLCGPCESRLRGIRVALLPEQLGRLSRHSTLHHAEAGQQLSGGSLNTETYSHIISGVVKLSKMMADGRLQIVGLQFAPDFLGSPLGTESKVTAQAATDVELCSFPRVAMDAMIREIPELKIKFYEQTLNELDGAHNWLLMLGRKTAAEKVASFLLLIATQADPKFESDISEFYLPLSRSDIGDFLGLTTETVSRQMTKLRKEKVIVVDHNRHVVVPDLSRLADLTAD